MVEHIAIGADRYHFRWSGEPIIQRAWLDPNDAAP
jgi:hypothetical protein